MTELAFRPGGREVLVILKPDETLTRRRQSSSGTHRFESSVSTDRMLAMNRAFEDKKPVLSE